MPSLFSGTALIAHTCVFHRIPALGRARRHQISQLASQLSGLKASWPPAWWRVKEELPAQKKSWLTFEEFCAFCNERNVTNRKDQEDLAASLHALGLMLSYRHEDALRNFGVLNPQWVTKGIYEILNSRTLREAGGKFTVETLSEVLGKRMYPALLHPYLLALMSKFRLCHPLDEKRKRYLIPELLTKEEPQLEAAFPPDKCLNFAYHYDSVLPEGLLPRFIVETYVHREPKHSWRTGVVLERANCRALVHGDIQGRKINIRVSGVGNGRRELLGIIREHFERIHRSYEKLPVTEMVPVPGHPESKVKHELLLKYERAGEATILVEVGNDLVGFSVEQLLDGVELLEARLGHFLWKDGWIDRVRRLHAALRVVVIYSPEDAAFLDQLRAALVPYERVGDLKIWADRLVGPGQDLEDEIISHLKRANIVIVLLSNDLLRSAECMDKELPIVLKRHEQRKCVLVPVLVRACRYDKLPIGKLQTIRPGGKPISTHRKRDAAWQEVTLQLDRVIKRIKIQKNEPYPAPTSLDEE